MDLRPVLATQDGTIYAGNMRYRAAKHLGWTEIPAILTDIDEATAKDRALRDNGSFGERQMDELSTLVDELQKMGTDIDSLGIAIPKIEEPSEDKEEVSFMADKESKRAECPICGYQFIP